MDKTVTLEADNPSSADQLAILGRLARKHLHRAELGAVSLDSSHRDPVALIQQQEKIRIQEFLPLRHHRMGQSAFAFYRGSALLMAHDLAEGRKNTGIHVQLCGDAHLANFGLFLPRIATSFSTSMILTRLILGHLNGTFTGWPHPIGWQCTNWGMAKPAEARSLLSWLKAIAKPWPIMPASPKSTSGTNIQTRPGWRRLSIP